MPSPIQIPRSCYQVLLVTAIRLFKSASAHLRLPNDATESLSGGHSLYDDDKADAEVRFLKDGATNNADFGVNIVPNEERGYLNDKFATVAIKIGLRTSLHMKKSPDQVLTQLVRKGNPLSEKVLFLWLKYVLQYRKKMGEFWATDTSVIKSLSRYIPPANLEALFRSMEKNPKLKSLGQDLLVGHAAL
ncbi:hypothetical protein GN244_ATG00751 [Phytophthora infestans]|uniref:RXLR phytopathogen effector protein WY-domain domain-containing protein n=1 Tax=Phytophthora infestans TaxID=4787 RepID=A0A833SDW6_PHYIN|nr:hypothetical protein GN244_ATG00751 [Phytophthora infestans]KAF4130467.1 hypothetical protein GN958_ATG20361 [Phytophthora infestans]